MDLSRDMAAAVTRWAEDEDNARAAILTSTRANPHAPVDELSDYDIELYVRDLQPFLEGDAWLQAFGDVLITHPYRPMLFDEGVRVWRLVMFHDAPRIDFNIQLPSVIDADRAEHGGYWNDMGYSVLVDKDGLTQGAVPPTYTQYDTPKPSQDEFDRMAHHFWWNITYVAKYLRRDQLYFAKWMLDAELHHKYLMTLLSWYAGVQSGWTSNPGARGRWLRQLLDATTWAEVENTFAGADREENWRAMLRLAELWDRIGAAVGDALGYAYPHQLARDVTDWLRRVHRVQIDPNGLR